MCNNPSGIASRPEPPAQTPPYTPHIAALAVSMREPRKTPAPVAKDGQQQVACQVQGCSREVPQTPYYKKSKLCRFHAKQECVEIEGRALRFCFRCRKFQGLEDFDDNR